jgi:hypothetical protein
MLREAPSPIPIAIGIPRELVYAHIFMETDMPLIQSSCIFCKMLNPFRPRNGETKAKYTLAFQLFRYAKLLQYSYYRNCLVVVFGFGFPVSGTEGVEKRR